MMAVTGRSPSELYRDLVRAFGDFVYERIDAHATPEQKSVLQRLSPSQIGVAEVAGDAITGVMTHAPGNGAPIGGVKVLTKRGWFAVRPSGTEDVYKLYAESFVGQDHLRRLQQEAHAIIQQA